MNKILGFNGDQCQFSARVRIAQTMPISNQLLSVHLNTYVINTSVKTAFQRFSYACVKTLIIRLSSPGMLTMHGLIWRGGGGGGGEVYNMLFWKF